MPKSTFTLLIIQHKINIRVRLKLKAQMTHIQRTYMFSVTWTTSQTHSLMWGSLLHTSACLFSGVLGTSQRQSATPEQVPACFQVFWVPVLAVCYRRASACLFSGVLGASPGSLLHQSRYLPRMRSVFFFNSQWPVNAFGLAEETPTLKTLFFLCCTPTRMLMIYLSATSPDNHSLS